MIEIQEAIKNHAAEIANLIMMAMTDDCCLYFCGESYGLPFVGLLVDKDIPEIDKVLGMFAMHSTGILNALRTGKNNGKAERLNGSIQELKTIGRGYKDAEHFRTAILFFHGGLVLHRDHLLLNSLS